MTSFYSWLNNKILSEVKFDFGKNKGKDHTEVDTNYLIWARDNIAKPTDKRWIPKWEALMSAIDDELEERKTVAKSVIQTPSVPKSPTPPSSPSKPKEESFPKYFAVGIVKKSFGAFKPEDIVVMTNLTNPKTDPNGDWEAIATDGLKATIKKADLKEYLESIKNEKDQAVIFSNLDEAMELAKRLEKKKEEPEEPEEREISPETHDIEDKRVEPSKNDSNLLFPDKKFPLTVEQKAIDEKFASNNKPLMISALAGSGKTSVLNHLAWKYGRGQRWLYLVFNNRNQKEAQEKFPNWVTVKTSNAFLGEILRGAYPGIKENQIIIPQTEVGFKIKEGFQKINSLIKSPKFNEFMKQNKIYGNLDRVHRSNRYSDEYYEKRKSQVQKRINAIQYAFKDIVLEITNLAKNFGVDPRNENEFDEKIKVIFDNYELDTNLVNAKKFLATKYSYLLEDVNSALGYNILDKDFKESIIKGVKLLLEESLPGNTRHVHKENAYSSHELHKYRDFNDDFYYTATHSNKIKWPKFDVALIDECQDFNEAQHIAIQKLAEQGARIVAVGDANQAIYKWRGSLSQSFSKLNDLLDALAGESTKMELTGNMRSKKKIIDYINEKTHVKNLQLGRQYDEGDEGNVTDQELTYDDSIKATEEEYKKNKEQKDPKKRTSTAYICRTNEPLLHVALKLLTKKIPFIVLGKDLLKTIKKHLNMIVNFKNLKSEDNVDNLSKALKEYYKEEQDSYGTDNEKKEELKQLKEITDALVSSIDQFMNIEDKEKIKNIENFIKWMEDNMSGLDVENKASDAEKYKEKMENQKPVVLATSFTSKGMEFDTVHILRVDLMPHPRAATSRIPDDLVQEENGKYIAYSRARENLNILKLSGQPGYKDK